LINSAVLLIDCPDQRGLVAAVSGFLYEHNANILHADQHQDAEAGLFFMRVEWDLAGFRLSEADVPRKFAPVAARFGMRWRVEYSGRRLRTAIFVSRETHCLVDLLHRHQTGELPCEIPLIVSNHPDAEELASFFRIPFALVPHTKEATQIEMLEKHGVQLVVLARYMRILSPDFVRRYPNRIINVHHSFLPAFIGARPYHQAYARGVKLIGATAHYVTEELDDGPIIEQDVLRVSHRDQLGDLIQKGRDLEKLVLSRAVRWHLEHRILSYANRTVVFD
jgi:formyltetrahydrofolate deformylase (EC 3.5.1.10)